MSYSASSNNSSKNKSNNLILCKLRSCKMVGSYHTQLKKNYEQRCREVDAADEAFKKSVSLASKDEEKVMKLKCSYRLYLH